MVVFPIRVRSARIATTGTVTSLNTDPNGVDTTVNGRLIRYRHTIRQSSPIFSLHMPLSGFKFLDNANIPIVLNSVIPLSAKHPQNLVCRKNQWSYKRPYFPERRIHSPLIKTLEGFSHQHKITAVFFL